MLSPHDLATLIAVADQGSIHRAALVLHRTQPAVTQAIQRLEEAVGFALLDRSGYRATVTERGATFVKRARATVQQARDLAAFAAVLSQGVEARLRIAIHGSVPSELALQLVHGVAACFPDTLLELQTGEGQAPLQRLHDDQCQLALLVGAGVQQAEMALETRCLGELEFANVVRSSDASDDCLARLPQIIVADFDDDATSYGVVVGHRAWRVSDHRVKAAAIRAGCGWGSVPVHMINAELSRAELQRIAYRGLRPSSHHPVWLCRKRERAQGPVATFIWQAVDDVLAHGEPGLRGDDKAACSSR
ncbi:MAG: LysR family transcriptional regulator [Polyangiales bacterium]